jgi:probable F420-dependent oxidoreductase
MTPPKLLLILSENHTMRPSPDLRDLVRFAVEAEAAGIDGVMVSEHVLLGPSANREGVPYNPRDYALPGNQEPWTPWPSSLVLLSAIAAATEQIRLVAGSLISPLRHPLALAKELATLDRMSSGRLVVQPTVSWHRDEYAALGVDFSHRGELLDEQLEIWERAWSGSPSSYEGAHYRFAEVWLEPGPWRPGGPLLWFGGSSVHERLIRRLVRYGHGFNPLGRPTDAELSRLDAALSEAGRSRHEIEYVGGTRGTFPDARSPAELEPALATIPDQVARGFDTICVKPSQFLDDAAGIGQFCRLLVERVNTLFETG